MYDISIGIITSSLQRDQIRNINARARPTRQRTTQKQRGCGQGDDQSAQGGGAGVSGQGQGAQTGGASVSGQGQGAQTGGALVSTQQKPFTSFMQPLVLPDPQQEELEEEEPEEGATGCGKGDGGG